MEVKTFLAFDIGASSGRAVLISFQGEKFEMKEIHRFAATCLFSSVARGGIEPPFQE